jgi:NAD-dependent deacetylase
MEKKKLVVLSGAGISAESGIKTFRDADGLWEGHDVMQVASPEGWRKNPALVLDFYNQRRAQLKEVKPNLGHQILAQLEVNFNVEIITQNVDDLHERAGSSNVTHLHGQLKKIRSVNNPNKIYNCDFDINLGETAEDGGQFRPHIVWFGEAVPMLDIAIQQIHDADYAIIVGTSLQVYPAAGLIRYIPNQAEVFYVDPRPHMSYEVSRNKGIRIIPEIGSVGLKYVKDYLLK